MSVGVRPGGFAPLHLCMCVKRPHMLPGPVMLVHMLSSNSTHPSSCSWSNVQAHAHAVACTRARRHACTHVALQLHTPIILSMVACASTRTCCRTHAHTRARARTRARAHTHTHTHTRARAHTQEHASTDLLQPPSVRVLNRFHLPAPTHPSSWL